MEDEREDARAIGYGGVTGHPLLREEAEREDARALASWILASWVEEDDENDETAG